MPCADTRQPTRQAELATPPKEGNCLEQIRGNHPVKRSLPPLRRRGIALSRYEATTPSGFACHLSTGGELPGADMGQPPRQAELDTPPQEGNCLVQIRETTPSSRACHPSEGGELPCADMRQPPRQAELDTPPQEGNCLEQIRHHHPVKRSLTPLHRRGIALSGYEATTPSSRA